MSKFSLAIAGGIGFLAGSRAGRGPYERAVARARTLRDDPRVRRSVADARDVVADKAGDAVQAAKAKADDLGSGSNGPVTATS